MAWTKVLIVDDEVEFASALAERLLLRDYEASAVNHAEDAIAAVMKDPPAVVLLDLRMPGIDGLALLQKLKKDFNFLKVIMLTGHGDPAYISRAMEAGASGYIMKPIDINELTKKIDAASQS